MTHNLPAEVLLATFGTLGDVHPFIALAKALQARGITPVIATSAMHRGAIEAEGVAFTPMRPDESDIGQAVGLDIAGVLRRMRRDPHFILDEIYLRFLDETYRDLLAAAPRARLVVAHSLLIGAKLAAESRALPRIHLALAPIHLQSALAPSLTPPLPYVLVPRLPIERRFNAALREILRWRLALKLRPVQAFRRSRGLASSMEDPFLDFGRPNGAVAVCGFYSNYFAALASDQPRNGCVVGFPIQRSGQHDLPSDLRTFLDTGPPPIVFTLGSFAVEGSGTFYAESLAAARAVGHRALLLTGARDAVRVAAMIDNDTFACAYAPHELVFPEAVAIVHHGGIGTTGAALRSGKPQLVVPFFGDQPDQAARLARLGVARVLRPRRYDARRASAELTALLAGSYSAAAQRFAAQIAGEDGADALADLVVETLADQGLSGSHSTGASR